MLYEVCQEKYFHFKTIFHISGLEFDLWATNINQYSGPNTDICTHIYDSIYGYTHTSKITCGKRYIRSSIMMVDKGERNALIHEISG